MSATRPSPDRTGLPPAAAAVPPARGMAELQARRRHARRRRRLLRVDVGLGLLVALLLLIAGPGLAIAALVAAGLLLACVSSWAFERRRGRAARGRRSGSRSRDDGAAGRR